MVFITLVGMTDCVGGLTTRQPLWVILCHLPEKRRREIEEIVEEIKEMVRGERKMNDSEETEEIKNKRKVQGVPQSQATALLYPYLLQGQQALPNCKPISVGCPVDVRYTTLLPHPTIPSWHDNLPSVLCDNEFPITWFQCRQVQIIWLITRNNVFGKESCYLTAWSDN